MALQRKTNLLVQFESTEVSAFHTLPLSFNPGDARDRNLFDRSVMTTPLFVRYTAFPFTATGGTSEKFLYELDRNENIALLRELNVTSINENNIKFV